MYKDKIIVDKKFTGKRYGILKNEVFNFNRLVKQLRIYFKEEIRGGNL